MPAKDKNILKYNPGEKSLKVANVIYTDLESLLIKKQSCEINPEKSYAEQKAIHEACAYSINLVRSNEPNKNISNFHRGKDCVKKLCKDLKTPAMEIINYEIKEMIPLTHKETKYYEKSEYCHICKEEFCNDKNNKEEFMKKQKVRDHCHYTDKFRGAAHSICNLRYKVQQEIPVVLHNGSNYD